ncbi:MAG: hypothetical protein NTV06_08615, partial [candidate division Zixibacteria bacterium]|nr:hypothetical protein [candidate division Zixibacteria bacterium]
WQNRPPRRGVLPYDTTSIFGVRQVTCGSVGQVPPPRRAPAELILARAHHKRANTGLAPYSTMPFSMSKVQDFRPIWTFYFRAD